MLKYKTIIFGIATKAKGELKRLEFYLINAGLISHEN